MVDALPPPTQRTTLYRLEGVEDLNDAVRPSYTQRDGFVAETVQVGGREALLVSGAMQTAAVPWASVLHGLTGQTLVLGNTTAAAVLIIRADGHWAWALAYGMGFHLLDQAKVDSGFGQRVAIRVAAPSELHSLTRTVLDQRSRIDRLSIPGGEQLSGFGAGDFGELVTRLVTRAVIPGLSWGDKTMTLRGADALSVPLGVDPSALLDDLEVLEEVLSREPAEGLEILEQIVAVKDQPDLEAALEEGLSKALLSPRQELLALSWPHERGDEHGEVSSFRVSGTRQARGEVRDTLPQLSDLLEPLVGLTPATALKRVKAMKVQLFRDVAGEDAVSGQLSAFRWLAFEIRRQENRYCLHNGRWYLMDQQYAERLHQQTEVIFARGPGLELPDWPAGMDEAAYNVYAAERLGGLCLDRRLIRTPLHRRGIEACDILTDDGCFVHVKHVPNSSPASHLLAQALVSTDALLHDEEARRALETRVEEKGWPRDSVPQRPKVVLGMAREGPPLDSASLFTFAQVALVRNAASLLARGVDVHIASIRRHV